MVTCLSVWLTLLKAVREQNLDEISNNEIFQNTSFPHINQAVYGELIFVESEICHVLETEALKQAQAGYATISATQLSVKTQPLEIRSRGWVKVIKALQK